MHILALALLLIDDGADRAAFAAAERELAPPQAAVAVDTKRIAIDLRSQRLEAWQGDELVYSFPCSTGRGGSTPRGEWPIRQKLRFNRALPEYGSIPIPYSLRLDIVIRNRRRLIAIHAHESVPPRPASHGCIRLRYSDAPKLFSWAEVGTLVTIR